MKLTKSKNAKEAFFYRDAEQGKLYIHDFSKEDSTDKIINELPFKASLAGRILSKCDRTKSYKQNPFENFIQNLIGSGKAGLPSKADIGFVEKFKAEKYFSHYGRALAVEKDGKKLKLMVLLKEYYENNENINEELKIWSDVLNARVVYKKERLKKSIRNNRIVFPFDINEANDKKNSKAQWLLDFVTDEGKFKKYEVWYSYWTLYETLRTLKADYSYLKMPQKFGGLIYEEVKKYHGILYQEKKDLISKEELQGFAFYLSEVQAYFRHYFGSSKAGKSLDKEYKINKLLEVDKEHVDESYPYKWVKAHITNKITALLIQNGKLTQYKVDHPTSDVLSNIQIEEAFKKKLFLSIAWAATRLNYFFNYGSNNDDLVGEPQNNSKIGAKIKGDILLEFNGVNTLKEIYQKNQKDTQSYMEYFLVELNENENNNKTVFQEKVCTTFPIQIKEDNQNKAVEDLLDVLDAAKESINYLRNNIFHPQKDYLYELTLPDKIKKILEHDYFAKIKDVLAADISRINSCFKEQFRSSLIADIYPFEFLQEIFTNCNLAFHIYAPKYELMPAFRKVYQRGANLCSQDGDKRNLSWFYNKPAFDSGGDVSQERNDIKKWQAYKNLLQMIYEHSFLPAVHDDESLITKYIETTINHSQEASRDRNKKYCFRYKNMPKHNGLSLAEYMANLQRLQSAEESNKHDNINNKVDDKNYYIDFVQDIFVQAFDQYLEIHLRSIKGQLLSSLGNDSSILKKEGLETTLDRLFQKDKPIISMAHDSFISENDDFCLLFYPFLRMLERRELSNLQHQVIRYRCSLKNRRSEELKSSEKLEQLIAMLIFTFPDHIDEEDCYKDMVEKQFTKFVEGSIEKYMDLYCQKEAASPTFIQQKSMLALMRTGAVALYSDMFDSIYKITQKDYKDYKLYCGLGENHENGQTSLIENAQGKLANIHQELCKERSIGQDDGKLKDYEKYLKFVNEYSGLRRKITFDLLYELHLIHVDILGRLASFAADWERDMHFLLVGLHNLGQQCGKDILTLSEKDIEDIYNSKVQGTMTENFLAAFKGEANRKILTRLCWPNDSITLSTNALNQSIRPRNSLAHLNHMTQLKQGVSYQKSIIELLARVSKLLNYDLKRKNSVTRVLKELLKKYHINLSLYQKSDYEYEIYTKEACKIHHKRSSIESENIVHLKNLKIEGNKKRITIPARDELFLKCIEKLLNFSYNEIDDKKVRNRSTHR